MQEPYPIPPIMPRAPFAYGGQLYIVKALLTEWLIAGNGESGYSGSYICPYFYSPSFVFTDWTDSTHISSCRLASLLTHFVSALRF